MLNSYKKMIDKLKCLIDHLKLPKLNFYFNIPNEFGSLQNE